MQLEAGSINLLMPGASSLANIRVDSNRAPWARPSVMSTRRSPSNSGSSLTIGGIDCHRKGTLEELAACYANLVEVLDLGASCGYIEPLEEGDDVSDELGISIQRWRIQTEEPVGCYLYRSELELETLTD